METETIRVAGKELEIRRIAGERSKSPAIVFLHEGLGSIALWRDFPDRLCARTGFAGAVYSRYGNGFSQPLDEPRDVEYMHREALEALPELLDKLELERPVLFGHSDGASIALIFAAAHPESVASLVLEAPHVFVEPLSVQSIAAIGAEFRAGSLRERMSRYHRDVDRTFSGWNDIWLAPAFLEWDITAMLPAVVAPALCIQGEEDEYGTLAQIAAIADGSRGPVDRLVLSQCGHAPHRDRAQYVESAAAEWLLALNTPDAVGSVRPTASRSEKR